MLLFTEAAFEETSLPFLIGLLTSFPEQTAAKAFFATVTRVTADCIFDCVASGSSTAESPSLNTMVRDSPGMGTGSLHGKRGRHGSIHLAFNAAEGV
jgi:hypothetical protein